jgi:hypothetical protein
MDVFFNAARQIKVDDMLHITDVQSTRSDLPTPHTQRFIETTAFNDPMSRCSWPQNDLGILETVIIHKFVEHYLL